MTIKQTNEREVMIEEILMIHRKLLNTLDDMELTITQINAWRMDATKPGDTEPMLVSDISISEN